MIQKFSLAFQLLLEYNLTPLAWFSILKLLHVLGVASVYCFHDLSFGPEQTGSCFLRVPGSCSGHGLCSLFQGMCIKHLCTRRCSRPLNNIPEQNDRNLNSCPQAAYILAGRGGGGGNKHDINIFCSMFGGGRYQVPWGKTGG